MMTMINTIFSIAVTLFIAIVTLGLAVVLFSIGLVALWYLFLIFCVIWLIRRVYYFIKGEKPPTVKEQYYYYNTRYTEKSQPKQKGRVIDIDHDK
jgi:hypothetical protein